MKKKFLDGSIALVRNNYPNYSEEKLEEIAYGLEGFYLSVTKMVILIIMASILGILKEFFLILLSYNILRTTAFGIHAEKSIYCLISSIVCFIIGAYFCKYVEINYIVKIVLTFISVMAIVKYAPADTEKRPLINAKRRKKLKLITSILALIYAVLIIIFDSNPLTNYLLVGMIEIVIMIHPLTYKILGHKYNNYEEYNRVV